MTEAEKRALILRSERDHNAPPPPAVALNTPGPRLAADIDQPFKILTAHPSKWYAPRGTVPTSVVIHCTAATNPASSTANFFASSAPSGSTQAVADDLEGYTMVPDDAVCAGAPPLNQEGLHIEQPGLTTWPRAEWLSHDNQLRRVAFHVAGWCKIHDIPVKLLHAADLRLVGEKARGITYHGAVTEAFHQSTHTDPGPNFPWDVFMGYVEFYFGGDELAVLTDDEQYELRGLLRRFKRQGPPQGTNEKVKSGFDAADKTLAATGAKPVEHDHAISGRTEKN